MSSPDNLFNSKSAPIPEVRRELEIIPVKNNGQSYLYFYDTLGYLTQNFALDQSAGTLLSLIDGRKSIEDLSPYLGNGVTTDQLLTYIQLLDQHRLLRSEHFKQYSEFLERQYEQSDIHKSVTAGYSYPADPKELKEYLDEAFSNTIVEREQNTSKMKALYAPHIDPRVGMESYVKAFSAIRNIKPERVVILATSHYAGLHSKIYSNRPFVISSKNFELPMGRVKADREAIDELLSASEDTDTGLTAHDRAHRVEHSIELHLLFLNYLWDHEYKIIPILVNSLDDLLYMRDGHRSKQVDAFAELIYEKFGADEETFFLISGDLAHIGKKFGDAKAAGEMLPDVKKYDRRFMKYAENSDEKKLLDLISESYDPYRICGYPPLYTFLKSMKNLKGRVLDYDLWDEQERESAVSFGSILYWNTK